MTADERVLRSSWEHYTKYKRTTAQKDYWCLWCHKQAIRAGDRALVRASDNCGRICLSCEAERADAREHPTTSSNRS